MGCVAPQVPYIPRRTGYGSETLGHTIPTLLPGASEGSEGWWSGEVVKDW